MTRDYNRCKAEIMCTLTASQIIDQPRAVMDMYEAGMRSVRINTAHLHDADELAALASRLKDLLPNIRILIDTKGPEMRTTGFEGDKTILLHQGDIVGIEGTDTDRHSTRHKIYVNYPKIHTEVSAGDRLLIDDGKISLRIESVIGCSFNATVTEGGELGSKKGVAVEGKDLKLPAVSERDRMFICYGASSTLIDEIAHSFVRSAADVKAVLEAMGGPHKPIIAKIENQQGIDNLRDIIRVSDGILIARGDLSASIGRDAIPDAQEKISSTTKRAKLPLYLATNILPSMMHSLQISDEDMAGIGTAKEQGVDVMLLTNETAAGDNPVASVATLHRILQGINIL